MASSGGREHYTAGKTPDRCSQQASEIRLLSRRLRKTAGAPDFGFVLLGLPPGGQVLRRKRGHQYQCGIKQRGIDVRRLWQPLYRAQNSENAEGLVHPDRIVDMARAQLGRAPRGLRFASTAKRADFVAIAIMRIT